MKCSTFKCPKLIWIKSLSIIFAIMCRVSAVDDDSEKSLELLRAFAFTHQSGYINSCYCPTTTKYIVAARVRLSNYLNQSHPTVTALELQCSDGIHAPFPANGQVLFQKNVGNWTEWKECSNGSFATGLMLHLEPVSNPNLIADEHSRDPTERTDSRFFDVFELTRSRYVAGITINCSEGEGSEMEESSQESNNNTLVKNQLSMGESAGMGLRLYCGEERAISGITLHQESITTYDQGERWIPLDISSRCSLLTNPVLRCYPELDWQKLEKMTCTNVTGDGSTVECRVPHLVGLGPNEDIENLPEILNAFKQMDLEGSATKVFLRQQLYGDGFRRDWEKKYGLTLKEYNRAVQQQPFGTYLSLEKEFYEKSFSNVNYEESEFSKKMRNKTSEPLKYEFYVKQLVGYCSIYKIHFPLFRSQFQMYFERKVSGVRSRITFPQVDESVNVAELMESKAALWMKMLKLFDNN